MPTKTAAIKAFLNCKTHPDLAAMYNHDMECQVNVAQGKGELIEGEFNGVKWRSFSDGVQEWKAFRIPHNAWVNPEYTDKDMTYDLGLHAEGIGMTGWDWKNKESRWVAFDFDAIVGHSEKHTQKLSSEELKRVQDMACEIPWVTVRYSTSGKGLHLYVMLEGVKTENHSEHAAVARSILAKMSSLTGYDFTSKVDVCGQVLWVWHRKMTGTEGLRIIKKGGSLSDIPPNWRDNLNVVKGVSKRLSAPTNITEIADVEQRFDILCGQRTRVPLDADHLKLISYLNENGLYHWWDQDRHMLVTHTASLKTAHKELGLKGIYETETKATSTHNCFAYPMRKGAWSIRRFSPGVKEHPSWDQDGAGWTRCYFNQDPTFSSAAHANSGTEDPNGGYHFNTGEDATKAANALGANVTIHPKYANRSTLIKPHKDGYRLVVEFPKESNDAGGDLPGWLPKGNKWIKIFSAQRMSNIETDSENYDDLVRHLVTEADDDGGWVLNSDGKWNEEPLNHIKAALLSMNVKRNEVDTIVGSSVLKPWTLTKLPFQPEYPGDRIWNRRAPQLRFPPSLDEILHYPTWTAVLTHIGRSLDSALADNAWAKKNGIKTGADYLKVWIASMVQYPKSPLPYLFIYGEMQETGKSTLHEGLEKLFYPGYMRVDVALQNTGTFNGEMQGAVLCVIEEVDLNQNKNAYNRVKDWVTSPKITIHAKHATPYMVDNTAHFIQTANNRHNCPIFPGDTRITMIRVAERPATEIPKDRLLKQLEKEASDFLGALMNLEIPESPSRLRVPVIETNDKIAAANATRNEVQIFIDERCHAFPGAYIELGRFYEEFVKTLDPTVRPHWSTKQKVSNAMPDWALKGKVGVTWCWGNISFEKPTEEDLKRPSYIIVRDNLMKER